MTAPARLDRRPPTLRELEVAACYWRSGSYKVTASMLGISIATVRAHGESLRQRAGTATWGQTFVWLEESYPDWRRS